MLRDLRHAIRVLVRAKGWTAVVLLSLALGIGANTALFSAINGQLLRTIAADDPDGLVRLSWYGDNDMARSHSEYGFTGKAPNGERRSATFPFATYQALREGNDTMAEMLAAAPNGRVNAIVDGRAEIASALLASGSYFDVLGLGAAAGRTVTAADDVRGAPPVAMISHGYWDRRFGRSPDVIGKVVTINNVPCTIVGVTPAGYDGIQGDGDGASDLHLPLALHPDLGEEDDLAEATTWWLQVMGRLRPGVTAAQVQGNLAGIFQAAAREGMTSYLDGLSAEQRALSRNQDRNAVPQLWVDSGRRGIYDTNPDTRRDAVLLGAVVILVLLVVCANVANLLLSRATTRQREIAVRLSLGATRARLVRQLVTESVFLAVLGGGLGLAIAVWARRLLPFGQGAPLDWKVFAFAGTLSVVTGVVFSVVPALRATAVGLSASLKESSRSVKGSRGLLGRGLLILQVAISLVLLMGAGLFLNTLRNLRSVDVGFDPTNILIFRLDPTLNGYGQERMPVFYQEVQERLEAVGGVESVSLSRSTFLAGSTWTSTVHFQGRDGNDPSAHMMVVSPEFFETLRIPLLSGRAFDDRDTGESQDVAVLNAAAVREFLEGEDALGRRFGFSPENRGDVEIVGVVRDSKYSSVRDDAPPTVFLLYKQRHLRRMTYELKTAGDPRALVPTVRDIVRGIDPNVPVIDVSTQSEQIEGRFRQERYFALSYSMFGGLAMLLAAIGLFGLASYSVAQRTNEIGVRMALGAQRGDVVRMILRESLALVGIGIVLGAVVTVAAGPARREPALRRGADGRADPRGGRAGPARRVRDRGLPAGSPRRAGRPDGRAAVRVGDPRRARLDRDARGGVREIGARRGPKTASTGMGDSSSLGRFHRPTSVHRVCRPWAIVGVRKEFWMAQKKTRKTTKRAKTGKAADLAGPGISTYRAVDKILPTGYRPLLNNRDTQKAIFAIKRFIEDGLADTLNLQMVQVPLIVEKRSGMNDNLDRDGSRTPVDFPCGLGIDPRMEVQVVQAATKWKRWALTQYGCKVGEGINTDMRAVRKDYFLDHDHSSYVDQWDWERRITAKQRNLDYLKDTVRSIWKVLTDAEDMVQDMFPRLKNKRFPNLPKELAFIHAEEILARYPDLPRKERETRILNDYSPAVFIIGIGWVLEDGYPHEMRAADYDDWVTDTSKWSGMDTHGLNGDILVWNHLTQRRHELTSMGIRVTKETLRQQLKLSGQLGNLKLPYHKMIMQDRIPLSIGGGIGQGRVQMLLLRKAHFGEVTVSVWPKQLHKICEKHNIHVLT